MDMPGRDHFERYKELLPGMDLDFMYDFSRAMHMFHKVIVLTESYFHQTGLSKGRFLILVNLLIDNSVDGTCIANLHPFYPVSSATMTGLLDTLEKEGMIERVPNPHDRRKVNIRITDKGRQFMMEFLPQHQASAKRMAAQLTEQDRRMLPDILARLVAGIEAFLEKDASEPVTSTGTTNGSETP